ncbi:MAG: hypothetical protein U1D30_22530 [Planctomycetota bacterium]
MKDAIHAVHGLANAVPIADITGDDFDIVAVIRILEPTSAPKAL